MAGHLNLLVLVLAVATGLVTASFSAMLVHSRRTAFFRYFLAAILLFNLLVLSGLVYRYVELQLREPGAPVAPGWSPVLLAVMMSDYPTDEERATVAQAIANATSKVADVEWVTEVQTPDALANRKWRFHITGHLRADRVSEAPE